MSPFRFSVVALLLVAVASVALGFSVSNNGPTIGIRLDDEKRPGIINPQIVGGKDATPGQFPHQVSMQLVILWFWKVHMCGGTIIDSKWILTAGHCVQGKPWYAGVEIAVGKHNINEKEASEQRFSVEQMIVHPDYKGGVGPNDIALIKIKGEIQYNDRVKPANLPRQDYYPDSDETILSGWGSTGMIAGFLPVMPNTLQTIDLPLVSYGDCKQAIGKKEPSAEGLLARSNICTGPLGVPGKSACSGDSGGPLVTDLGGGDVEVIGVVSWGFIPCGDEGLPSVYTKVSSFKNWIDEQIKPKQ